VGYSHLPDHIGNLKLRSASSLGSPLSLTEAQAAPAFDAEEQNNIAVYKKGLPSVVNITSKSMAFNFFYGQVPQEGKAPASFSTRLATFSPTSTSLPTPIGSKSRPATSIPIKPPS